ncbi:ATP-binding protein [Paraburkholderia youngii]|uniref:ATP-binding protein n=1 Tax=Paraburkholderia youngii TaxID=2782701 RepID=UPI003D1B12CC
MLMDVIDQNSECDTEVLERRDDSSSTNQLALRERHLAVHIQPNERLADLMRIRTTEEIRQSLAHRGVPRDTRLWTADASYKMDAMAGFMQSYVPSEAVVTFTEDFLAKYRRTLRLRDFEDADYREFFFSTREVLQGEAMWQLPSSMNPLKGAIFTMTGPSGMGRSAYLLRLRQLLGKPFVVYGNGKAPAMMRVIPAICLDLSEGLTLKEFFRDLKYALSAAVATKDTSKAMFPELTGENAANCAIALCILLNVGVLIVDGACWGALGGEPDRILAFLVRLQQSSGIPVVLSGTCPFMYAMGLAGSKSSNLFAGRHLYLDAYARPEATEPDEGATSGPKWQGAWVKLNLWLWQAGTFGPEVEMPADLPLWTYDLAMGRTNWLVQIFDELHIQLIKKPELLKPGALTREAVTKFAESRLFLQNLTREVVAEYQESDDIEANEDFFNHIDHLPLLFLQKPKSRNLMAATRG